MKNFNIDNYLGDIDKAVDHLGRRVDLVGLCQGGWMSSMYAARLPAKVRTLVLAGTPIDTDAGDGPIKRMALTLPLHFYEALITAGAGILLGKTMLAGWKGMNPQQQYWRLHTQRKGSKDKPISDARQRRNHPIAKTRARIEHVFAGVAQMGSTTLRCIGLTRAKLHLNRKGVAYNLQRLVYLKPGQLTLISKVVFKVRLIKSTYGTLGIDTRRNAS